MDEAVISTTNAPRCGMRILLAALALMAAAVAPAVRAQALQDPTRPPAALAAPAPGAAAAVASEPQLQSILMGRPPNNRRVAVIDGETVRLGDAFRGARVARVTDNEVTLVRGRERQTLRLFAQGAGPDGAARAAH